jgi:hypothetical protein
LLQLDATVRRRAEAFRNDEETETARRVVDAEEVLRIRDAEVLATQTEESKDGDAIDERQSD